MRGIAAAETLAEAALRYANLGIPVFPCVPGAKQPLTPNGFHDATSSAKTVHDWWRRSPDANIGLPTGATTGLLVVDVDVHSGGSGFDAFERARSAGLADSWGWMVRTPSGGLHAYYPVVPGQEQRSWQVPAVHVDFRGDGGYVIAPPSRIEVDGATKRYAVIALAHEPTRPLDALRLRRFLEPPRPIPPPAPVPALGSKPERLAAWVATLPEGGRNRGLFWASCRMVELGSSFDDTVALLGHAGQQAGLPAQEIETTIRSAFRIASRPSHGSRQGPTRSAEVIHL